MKSASGKRPADEADGPGKETIRPQQRCLGKSRRSELKNSAKCCQAISHICTFTLKLATICECDPKFTNVDDNFPEIPNFYGHLRIKIS